VHQIYCKWLLAASDHVLMILFKSCLALSLYTSLLGRGYCSFVRGYLFPVRIKISAFSEKHVILFLFLWS